MACREGHAPALPSCEMCPSGGGPNPERPVLLAANGDAWRLFHAAKTQWRVGAMGAVGLDYQAVEWVSERLDVVCDLACLRKLGLIEQMQLET